MVLGVARGGRFIIIVLLVVDCCYGDGDGGESGVREFSPGTVGVGEVFGLGGGGVETSTSAALLNVSGGSVPTKASRLVTAASAEEDDERDELMIGSSSSSPEVMEVSLQGGSPAVPLPEDSSRGKVVPVYHNSGGGQHGHHQYGMEIDRRKVAGGVKDGGSGGSGGSGGGGGSSQDLSFTGILNGLLDSFINDVPPQQSLPRPKSSTTPSPLSDDTSTELLLAEDDEMEEEEDEEVEASPEEPQKSASSLKKQKQNKPEDTSEPLLTNSEEQQLEEEGEEEDDDAALLEALSEATNSTVTTKRPPTRRCEGECRNIIFGLFLCDEIDNDAFCSEPGLACCVNNNQYSSYGNLTSSEEVNLANEHDLEDGVEDDEDVATTQQQSPPVQQQQPNRYQNKYNRIPPQPMRGPPPPHHHHHYNPYYYSQQQQQPQPQPSQQQFHHPPPQRMPLPCPRYCVKNFLESYCTDRLPSQFACGVDGFCCAHDVPVNSHNKDENGDDGDNNNNDDDDGDVYRNEGVGGSGDDEDESGGNEKDKVIGPCTEEIGSCVSRNIINIICFGHATPTEMYTCPRTSMKCCARKTALPKDSLPQTTTPPPPKLQDNSRNASSTQFQKPNIHHMQQQQQQQVLPQFAPHPHHPQQQQQHPQYTQQQSFQQPNTAQTPPPETPPPHSSSPNQFTQFIGPSSSSSTNSLSRIPPRQPVGQYVCGVKGVPTVSKKKKRRRKKRVVGGSDSLPGEWCWQVALINSLNQYLCGGALIGTQWVLTAAHCVTNIVRSGDAIYVRVGDHDLTSRYGSPGAQTLRVATTYIHHNHNSQTLDNDIALLKLQGNAALKEGVCLVCLPSRNHMSEIPGKRCIVTGYGYMGESGPIPLRIREANLPIVSEEECVRKVNAVTEKVFALPMSSFCAGGELRNDACQGDGGGPLVCRADDPTTGDPGTGYYELTGLVSWGFGCGRENVPGVYVKVSSFIGWIHQIIRSN